MIAVSKHAYTLPSIVFGLVVLVLAPLLAFEIGGASGPTVAIGFAVLVVSTVGRLPPWVVLGVLPVSIPFGVAFRLPSYIGAAPVIYGDIVILWAAVLAVTQGFRPPRRLVMTTGLLIIWSLTCSIAAADAHLSLAACKTVVMACLVLLITVWEVQRSATPAWVPRRLLLLSGGTGILIAILILLQLQSLGVSLTTSAESKSASDLGVGGSNYLAAIMLLSAVAVVVSVRSLQARVPLAITVSILALLLLGIAVTGSRTQVAVYVLGVPFLAGVCRPVGQKVRLSASWAAVALASAGAAWLYLPLALATWAPALRSGVTTYRTFQQREYIWASVLTTVKQHPFFGVGLQNLELPSGQYVMAHNVFLQVAAETGILGLLLFAYLLVQCLLLPRAASGRLAILGVFLVTLASGCLEPTLRTREYDYLFWLIIASVAASEAREAHAVVARECVVSV
jgi:O-antigen ligase